jgi:oligoribonuclease
MTDPAKTSDLRYCLLDLETTGLDPFEDSILEVAAIALTQDLEEISRIHHVVKRGKPRDISPKVQRMHEDNGLWKECEAAQLCELEVDIELAYWMSTFQMPPKSIMLAGNSPQFDHKFLLARMPLAASWLHYRLMDIGALGRWLADFGLPITKPDHIAHRALADCESELAQARMMRDLVKGLQP